MTLRAGAVAGKAAARALAGYLQEIQLDESAQRAAAYYSQTNDAEPAIEAGVGCLPVPRADMAPEVAAALGISETSKPVTTEALANLLGGQRADGRELDGHARGHGTYRSKTDSDAKDRHELAFLDLTISACKSFSVAWALAETEAERQSLLQCHRIAVAETMAYVEQQVGWARMGEDGLGGLERARLGYVTCQHYTARPTLEIARTDPGTGEAYTELRSVPVPGDPQIHTHVIVPNVMVTESGRTVALNTRLFHGRFHEFGAVHDAILGRELRRMGVDTALDERTNKLCLPAVPEALCDEFSKRHHDAEGAARAYAAEQGRDFDALTGEEKSSLLAYGARSTREDKESNQPGFASWSEQARRAGFEHKSVVSHSQPLPPRDYVERMDAAEAAALPHLAEMLSKRAVIGQGDIRLAAARGFIAEGMGTTADIDAMMKQWAGNTVLQNGHWTRLVWREVEGGRVKLTTELHHDQETELIRLARSAAGDRTHSLASPDISAAVARSGITYSGEHGKAQRAAVDTLGTGGGLAVMIGVAGSGKTHRVLPPLVDAWKARGLEVWGVAQAWRQARELEGAGIDHYRARALQPFLDGQDRPGRNAVVVLDEVGQIGSRQMLQLLRLREERGFKLVLMGDPRQCAAIEAGPVIDLLSRSLGPERIPQLLLTVRQQSETERRIATLFREGRAADAIAAKRESGTAELVPGGYRAAVKRVAGLYAERRRATANLDGYRITISAPTNADAREIASAVRLERRAMGEVGVDRMTIRATDGRGSAYRMALADGDNVRLYARTRGLVQCKDGRRRQVAVGDNGSVLRVLAVLPDEGLRVATATGTEAFVPWANLRDPGSNRVLLGYGDCLTIDSSQGITSDEHIDAMPSGSRAVQGAKAYVAESRHRVRSYMVGSMGAEMRQVRERRPAGLPEPTPDEAVRDAWGNVVRNLSAQPVKDSALAFLERAVVSRREAVRVFQGALRQQESRVASGESATTLRQRAEVRTVAAAMPAMARAVDALAEQRLLVQKSVWAMRAYWSAKTVRRLDVAARLVSEGALSFSDALERVIGAELADQKRHAPVDPVHELPKTPSGTLGADTVERRMERRLMAVIDRVERGAVAKERVGEAARA